MVEWRSFVVLERPSCMYGVDLAMQNDRFLASLDPGYFTYGLDSQLARLEGPDKQRVALSIRAAYAHSLETFFAVLAAAVQAPHCPLGWVLQYRNNELEALVGKIDKGEPIFSITKFKNQWHGLAHRVHTLGDADLNLREGLAVEIGNTWSYLAKDFLNTERKDEYNSIKHGLRATSVESTTTIGPAVSGGAPLIDSTSQFGGNYSRVRTLTKDRVHFELELVQKNWSPRALVARTQLVALSIGNVVSFLRGDLGVSDGPFTVEWPQNPSLLQLAWQCESPVRSARFRHGFQALDDDMPTKDQILANYGVRS